MPFINFVKMAGAGNDFIMIDNRSGKLKNLPALAKRFCERRFSIGADGAIFLEKSKKWDARMRIINPDGSEAEMCGNGVRCLAKFASELTRGKTSWKIETIAGVIDVQIKRDVVKAKMSEPKDMQLNLDVPLEKGKVKTHFINTGVPHAVVLVDEVGKTDVFGVGRSIRHHQIFAPKGTNVNFISVEGGGVRVRTYERGVEDETLACGTGSTASALVAAAVKNLKSPVQVQTQGGKLKIYFSKNENGYENVYLEGPVLRAFEGRVGI